MTPDEIYQTIAGQISDARQVRTRLWRIEWPADVRTTTWSDPTAWMWWTPAIGSTATLAALYLHHVSTDPDRLVDLDVIGRQIDPVGRMLPIDQVADSWSQTAIEALARAATYRLIVITKPADDQVVTCWLPTPIPMPTQAAWDHIRRHVNRPNQQEEPTT